VLAVQGKVFLSKGFPLKKDYYEKERFWDVGRDAEINGAQQVCSSSIPA